LRSLTPAWELSIRRRVEESLIQHLERGRPIIRCGSSAAADWLVILVCSAHFSGRLERQLEPPAAQRAASGLGRAGQIAKLLTRAPPGAPPNPPPGRRRCRFEAICSSRLTRHDDRRAAAQPTGDRRAAGDRVTDARAPSCFASNRQAAQSPGPTSSPPGPARPHTRHRRVPPRRGRGCLEVAEEIRASSPDAGSAPGRLGFLVLLAAMCAAQNSDAVGRLVGAGATIRIGNRLVTYGRPLAL